MPAKAATERRSDIEHLERIIKNVLQVVSDSQEQIFTVADRARSECQLVAQELSQLQQEIQDLIQEVDLLEEKEQEARRQLLKVSTNLGQHTEAEIRLAYEHARDRQVKLLLAREREKILRLQRNSLEVRLRHLKGTAEMAEGLVSQVGMAMEILKGDLGELSQEVRDLRQRQELAFSVLKAQEEERKRVARDIHDGPAQLLANVIFRLQVCERFLPGDVRAVAQELAQLKGAVRACLQDVRKIIFDLRPIALDDLGLLPGLRGFIEEFRERTGLPVRFVVVGREQRLASAVEIAVFRMIQEALHNVHKHAQATEAVVKVELGAGRVTAVIEDDGCGFDPEQTLGNKSPGGFGLLGLRERVFLLGGELAIKAGPGLGTRIEVRIPLQRDEMGSSQTGSKGSSVRLMDAVGGERQ